MLKNKIFLKIFLTFLLSFIVYLIASELLKYGKIKKIVFNEALEKIENRLDAKVSQLDGFFKEKLKIAHVLQYNPWIKQWLRAVNRGENLNSDEEYQKIVHYLNELKQQDPDLKSVFFASDHSQLYYDFSGYVSESNYYLNNRPWYQEVKRKRKIEYTSPSIDLKDTSYAISVNAPILGENGEFIGVTGIDLTLKKVINVLQSISFGKNSFVFAFGHDGTIYVHPDTSLVMKSNLADLEKKGVKGIASIVDQLIDGSDRLFPVLFKGKKYFLYSKKIPTTHWGIAILFPEQYIYAPLSHIKYTMQVSSFLGLIIMALIMFFIASYLTKPILQMVTRFSDLNSGEGDLTIRIAAHSNDEIGAMARLFNQFMDKLSSMLALIVQRVRDVKLKIQTIFDESENVMEKIEEQTGFLHKMNDSIAQTEKEANDIHNHAREQLYLSEKIKELVEHIVGSLQKEVRQLEKFSQSLIDASSSLEEISQSSETINENMSNISHISSTNKEYALKGKDKIYEVEKSIEALATSAENTSSELKELEEKIGHIDDILKVINEIADQTNLLALNAAIEAARAGEAGRGFSIVADEIRKLAEQTSQATSEIAEMVKSIKNSTRNAVEIGIKNSQNTNTASEFSRETIQIFDEIYNNVQNLDDSIQQVTQAIHEQTQGLQRIAEFMQKIKEISINIHGEAKIQADTSSQIQEFVDSNASYATEMEKKAMNQTHRMEELAKAINDLIIIDMETEKFMKLLRENIESAITAESQLFKAIQQFKFNGRMTEEKSIVPQEMR